MTTPTSAARFVRKINEDFGRRCYVEVSVLDGNGDKFDVFSGIVEALRADHMRKVFRDVGCFYMFSVLGIHEDLMCNLDEHQSSMRRVEFCWLVEPAPPKLEGVTATGAVLSWKSVRFCGFEPPPSFVNECGNGVAYNLEVAEAHAYKAGIGSHFASDTCASRYHTVCSKNSSGNLAITDLEPGTWYHARIAIVYMGLCFESVPTTFYTDFSAPLAPERPRLSIVSEVCASDVKIERTPGLIISWSMPKSFGLDINMCEVQFQELVNSSLFDEREPPSPLYVKRSDDSKIAKFLLEEQKVQQAVPTVETTPVFGPPYGFKARELAASKDEQRKLAEKAAGLPKIILATVRPSTCQIHNTSRSSTDMLANSNSVSVSIDIADSVGATSLTNQVSEEVFPTAAEPFGVRCTAWTSIYKNKNNRIKLKAPRPGVVEWRFRVRVCNSSLNSGGWSEWSPSLYIHGRSHPELFLTSDIPGVDALLIRAKTTPSAHSQAFPHIPSLLDQVQGQSQGQGQGQGQGHDQIKRDYANAESKQGENMSTEMSGGGNREASGTNLLFMNDFSFAEGHTVSDDHHHITSMQHDAHLDAQYNHIVPEESKFVSPHHGAHSAHTHFQNHQHQQHHQQQHQQHHQSEPEYEPQMSVGYEVPPNVATGVVEEWTYIAEDIGGSGSEQMLSDLKADADTSTSTNMEAMSMRISVPMHMYSSPPTSSPKLQRPTSDDSFIKSRVNSQASQRGSVSVGVNSSAGGGGGGSVGASIHNNDTDWQPKSAPPS